MRNLTGSDATTLVDAFGGIAERAANRFAVRFAHDDATVQSRSYGELDDASARIAGWLSNRVCRGDRVLLSFQPGVEFAEAFLGCLYAGAIPVPVPPPGRGRSERIDLVAVDSDARIVLTDRTTASQLGDGDSSIRALTTPVGLIEEALTHDRRYRADQNPDAVAFLQYTSGSTSDPKGVVVTNANLIANIATMSYHLEYDADTRMCSWLPVFHDMGLIAMLLAPLALGAETTLMAPHTFVRHPITWLDLITEHRATASTAPNFAYELCTRKITDEQLAHLDLSSWVNAANGAEPIRAETLAAFARRFERAGFRADALRPVYGLAEATLFASGTPARRGVLAREVYSDALAAGRIDPFEGPVPSSGDENKTCTVVSSGRAADTDIVIVDPNTLHRLDDGAVGEVWLRGPGICAGYWERPDETDHAFASTTADGDSGYLRTGDLGALLDGELFVTGRLKEVLVVSGRNLYPHDLESSLRQLDPAFAGRPGAAFTVPVSHGSSESDADSIVLVQEIRPDSRVPEDLSTLLSGARTSIGRQFGVSVAGITLVGLGHVERTTSGKVRRRHMRDMFVRNELTVYCEHLAPVVTSRYRAVDGSIGGTR
ncbi:fatty acyl-AMP ligase [Rhodococcus sp. IEGM 1381]|uniref:fatty acyl-AMP ligase n=1 Tax=Rhodococcus sp. IEGM 1381 TaxID=3047085 RepID=UPI0024B6C50E|nr:fatty acyl-AMP ligase [Rhodococcus sp. IEGM 1381]MDI9894474.1 fatty acyl-AMP ligase [Rhodococcus sp. IEGM 1381]